MSTRVPRRGEAVMTVEEVHPAAPLEPAVRVFTALVSVLTVGSVVWAIWALTRSSGGGWVVVAAVPSLLVALIVIPLAFSPSGYAIGASDLAVTRRAVRPLLFPLAGLASARRTAMPPSWRVLGSGGVFGFWGWFSNRDWGRFKVYATNRRHGVLLEWPGFKLFITPEDPDALCVAVLARAKSGRR